MNYYYSSILLLLTTPYFLYAQVLPETPTNFHVTEKTSFYVNLQWNESKNAIGYRINRESKPLLSVVGNEIQDTQVFENETYTYTISAYNNVGQSKQSESLVVTIPDTISPILSALYPRAHSFVSQNLSYLSFLTNEDAECVFNDISNIFNSTGKKVHIAKITLSNTAETNISFACTDIIGNTIDTSFKIFVREDSSDISQIQFKNIQKTIDELIKQIEVLEKNIQRLIVIQK